MIELPAKNFFCLNDEQVQLLAQECGIAGRFTKPPDCEYGSVFINVMDHPTHYLLFCRFHGHSRPKDNGYTLEGWFKATCSRAEAIESMMKTIRAMQSETLWSKPLPEFTE